MEDLTRLQIRNEEYTAAQEDFCKDLQAALGLPESYNMTYDVLIELVRLQTSHLTEFRKGVR